MIIFRNSFTLCARSTIFTSSLLSKTVLWMKYTVYRSFIFTFSKALSVRRQSTLPRNVRWTPRLCHKDRKHPSFLLLAWRENKDRHRDVTFHRSSCDSLAGLDVDTDGANIVGGGQLLDEHPEIALHKLLADRLEEPDLVTDGLQLGLKTLRTTSAFISLTFLVKTSLKVPFLPSLWCSFQPPSSLCSAPICRPSRRLATGNNGKGYSWNVFTSKQ